MSDLTRLREILRTSATATPRRELTYVPVDVPEGRSRALDSAACLGAREIDTSAGSCLVIDRVYAPTTMYGNVTVGEADVSGDPGLVWLSGPVRRPSTRLGGAAGPMGAAGGAGLGAEGGALRCGGRRDAPALDRVAFVDLETTGLSGGAGMCAFLVGCAIFEDGAFRIRQFFLPTFAHERALLTAVAEHLEDADVLVTYNGKSFDLPVMETRWSFHRMPPALEDKLHVDMLHPARRFWRGRGRHRLRVLAAGEESCTLVALERALFGQVRCGDVSGFEIPGRYFHFVRTGEAQPLEPVLEHNRLDLISLALLTARAVRLVRDGPSACLDAGECVALGRTYETVGEVQRALDCYARGAGLDGVARLDDHARARRAMRDAEVEADALRRLAVLLRRCRAYARAATAWQRLLAIPGVSPVLRNEAREALAIHHEHRARDLGVARELALGALGDRPSSRQSEALTHRLARLDAKLARRSTARIGPLLDRPA